MLNPYRAFFFSRVLSYLRAQTLHSQILHLQTLRPQHRFVFRQADPF